MLPAPMICSGNPTPESKSMPSGPSPDQPRSEGSQVPKKGAWEEEVEGCTHLGEEPLDSQGCDHVAVKEGSGWWWGTSWCCSSTCSEGQGSRPE